MHCLFHSFIFKYVNFFSSIFLVISIIVHLLSKLIKFQIGLFFSVLDLAENALKPLSHYYLGMSWLSVNFIYDLAGSL